MSFYKHYPNRKDHRKPSPYSSRGCKPHGGCDYCLGNRKHSERKREAAATQILLDKDNDNA